MNRPALTLTVLALWCLTAAGPALAKALAPGERFAQHVGTQALAVAGSNLSIQQKANHFRALIRRYGAIRSIGSFSLGPYRRKLPRHRSGEYYRLVEHFMARFFVTYAGRFRGNRMDIVRTKNRGPRDSVVEARVIRPGRARASQVAWRLIRRGRGYKVMDIKLLGIWLSLQMRLQFVNVLKANNGNFNALFAFMRR